MCECWYGEVCLVDEIFLFCGFGQEFLRGFSSFERKIFQNQMENDYVIFEGWRKKALKIPIHTVLLLTDLLYFGLE